jgi:hypothetical protein
VVIAAIIRKEGSRAVNTHFRRCSPPGTAQRPGDKQSVVTGAMAYKGSNDRSRAYMIHASHDETTNHCMRLADSRRLIRMSAESAVANGPGESAAQESRPAPAGAKPANSPEARPRFPFISDPGLPRPLRACVSLHRHHRAKRDGVRFIITGGTKL